MGQNKKEVTEEFVMKKEVHKAEVFQFDSQAQITLTSQQCKSGLIDLNQAIKIMI